MNLMDFKAVRRPENFMTGARLTPAGHALSAGLAAGNAAYKGIKSSMSIRTQELPGIHKAPVMGADMRQSPTMGSSGALAMALSDIENSGGVSGLNSPTT